MPEAARADHDARGARIEQGNRLTDGVLGRDAGIGESGDVFRPSAWVQLHARPRRGEQLLRHAAVVRQARERAAFAVHVIAGPASAAQPAGWGGVQDDGVAGFDIRYCRADLMHPAGVLMAECDISLSSTPTRGNPRSTISLMRLSSAAA